MKFKVTYMEERSVTVEANNIQGAAAWGAAFTKRVNGARMLSIYELPQTPGPAAPTTPSPVQITYQRSA